MAKKMKSSTYLSAGPIVAAQRMSKRASPKRLNNPPDDFLPKQVHIFSANSLGSWLSWSLTTTPGHWFLASGIIQYASETSRHTPIEPGSKDHVSVAVIKNVPQVHGYKSDSMLESIECMSLILSRYNKFCMSRNLLGLLGLGINESGDVWNGPMKSSNSAVEYGPQYHPFWNSLFTISLNMSWCIKIDGWLGGVKVE